MSENLAIELARPTQPSTNLALLVEQANEYLEAAKSENTRSAYRSDWKQFEAWCRSEGLQSLPALPSVVVTYLTSLACKGRKVSTIGRAVAGIGAMHRSQGFLPPSLDPLVRITVRGIRRKHGSAPTQKRPMDAETLGNYVRTLDDDLASIRNRALLTLGWFGAFRRSELVGLDVSDLSFTNGGLIVQMRRSKTDQEGKGFTKGIPYASLAAACPVRAVRAWLDSAKIEAGPIFRRVTRSGRVMPNRLADQTVARVVKKAAASLGLNPMELSGHSLRAGLVSSAAKRGKRLDAIMRQTGHKSEQTVLGYIRRESVFEDNAAVGLL